MFGSKFMLPFKNVANAVGERLKKLKLPCIMMHTVGDAVTQRSACSFSSQFCTAFEEQREDPVFEKQRVKV